MKLKETALGNAAAVLGAFYYLVCYAVASFVPDLYKTVAESWMHMLNLNNLWKSAPEGLIVGFVSFTSFSWVTGWLFASSYNRLAKK